MKTANHTPGPWKYNSTWGLIEYGKTQICALHSGNKANANLISAAPDMFNALQAVVDYLETFACHDEQGRIALSKAQETIAKAKVESK
jgi:hypothetical protein